MITTVTEFLYPMREELVERRMRREGNLVPILHGLKKSFQKQPGESLFVGRLVGVR